MYTPQVDYVTVTSPRPPTTSANRNSIWLQQKAWQEFKHEAVHTLQVLPGIGSAPRLLWNASLVIIVLYTTNTTTQTLIGEVCHHHPHQPHARTKNIIWLQQKTASMCYFSTLVVTWHRRYTASRLEVVPASTLPPSPKSARTETAYGFKHKRITSSKSTTHTTALHRKYQVARRPRA